MNAPTLSIPQVMQKAMAHHRQHELQQALDLYAQVIEAQPGHLDALYLAGVLLVQDKHFEEGLNLLDRALAIQPNHHELQYNRANALQGLHRYKEALQGYSRAIELKPDFALAFLGQSNALYALKAHEQAAASIDSAIKLMPSYAMLFFNRGNIMESLGKEEEAIRSFERATQLDSGYTQAWYNRGNLLALSNRFEDAQKSYKEALRLNPAQPDAYVSLAAALLALDRTDEASANFEQAIGMIPDHADAHYLFSHCLLQAGRFDQAWNEYAWRWKARTFEHKPPLATSKPRWNPGDHPARLLVWAEQGVGDEIFWVSQLRAGQTLADQLTVQTDPRLLSLFRRALPDIRFVSSKEVLADTEFDAHLPMGDLGQALQLTAEKVMQNPARFLKANSERAKEIKSQLCPPGHKLCGLSWRSKNRHIGGKKSLSLSELLPALKQPGLVFVNLQYGDVAQEIADLKAQHGIEVIEYADVDNKNDLEGLADLIEACDLVLTTSSTTAHLAGAVNKTTLNLVSRGSARIWYWRNEAAGNSLWYPSVKLFAQEPNEPGWQGAIERATAHMKGLL